MTLNDLQLIQKPIGFFLIIFTTHMLDMNWILWYHADFQNLAFIDLEWPWTAPTNDRLRPSYIYNLHAKF